MKYEATIQKDGSSINIPMPESYEDCFVLINSDIYRMTGKCFSSFHVVFALLNPFHSHFLFWFRMCKYKGWLYPFCRLFHKFESLRWHIDFPIRTKVGYGFYMSHGFCIVVNGGTVIGNNVTISQFMNIGSNDNTPAIIGDNVWMGPGVCVVEDVQIGSNSTIGAGAVVTKDVPSNSTCAGVPARVLNYDNPGRYIVRPWRY